MKTTVKIRTMAMMDVAKVHEIESASYPSPWSEKLFFDCLMVGYPAWVLDIDGKVVGYMIISLSVEECHILNICLSHEMRGKGFGKMLLEYGLNFARKHGIKRAILEVRPSNHIAIDMYKKHGFELIGIREGYYQDNGSNEDAIVFSLTL